MLQNYPAQPKCRASGYYTSINIIVYQPSFECLNKSIKLLPLLNSVLHNGCPLLGKLFAIWAIPLSSAVIEKLKMSWIRLLLFMLSWCMLSIHILEASLFAYYPQILNSMISYLVSLSHSWFCVCLVPYSSNLMFEINKILSLPFKSCSRTASKYKCLSLLVNTCAFKYVFYSFSIMEFHYQRNMMNI